MLIRGTTVSDPPVSLVGVGVVDSLDSPPVSSAISPVTPLDVTDGVILDSFRKETVTSICPVTGIGT